MNNAGPNPSDISELVPSKTLGSLMHVRKKEPLFYRPYVSRIVYTFSLLNIFLNRVVDLPGIR